MTDDSPRITWLAAGQAFSATWRSAAGAPPPPRVVVVDDTISADRAWHLACEGTAMLWHADFQNARQLLAAMTRRADRKPRKAKAAPQRTPHELFHLHRQAQAQRARALAMLLVPINADYRVPLHRAPDLSAACRAAWGPPDPSFGPSVVALRELLGLIGAHEWRKNGVDIPALDATVHPHYGVFSPLRGEYIDLVEDAPLPHALADHSLAFDIGTGTGVLALLLARRGVQRVIATDNDERALACALDNVTRFALGAAIEVRAADLFPDARAALIVCNPPWVPARASTPIERAVYDPGSQMLRGFLSGLRAHLLPGGEGWLILSDLAEHLGLRTRVELEAMFAAAGLVVLGRLDVRPRHGKALDRSASLYAARSAEITSLWRLGAA